MDVWHFRSGAHSGWRSARHPARGCAAGRIESNRRITLVHRRGRWFCKRGERQRSDRRRSERNRSARQHRCGRSDARLLSAREIRTSGSRGVADGATGHRAGETGRKRGSGLAGSRSGVRREECRAAQVSTDVDRAGPRDFGSDRRGNATSHGWSAPTRAGFLVSKVGLPRRHGTPTDRTTDRGRRRREPAADEKPRTRGAVWSARRGRFLFALGNDLAQGDYSMAVGDALTVAGGGMELYALTAGAGTTATIAGRQRRHARSCRRRCGDRGDIWNLELSIVPGAVTPPAASPV